MHSVPPPELRNADPYFLTCWRDKQYCNDDVIVQKKLTICYSLLTQNEVYYAAMATIFLHPLCILAIVFFPEPILLLQSLSVVTSYRTARDKVAFKALCMGNQHPMWHPSVCVMYKTRAYSTTELEELVFMHCGQLIEVLLPQHLCFMRRVYSICTEYTMFINWI